MVSIKLGPELVFITECVSNYVSDSLKPKHLRLIEYNEEDNEISTIPTNGTYTLDNVTITFHDENKIHALDARLSVEINIILEADSLETIKNFLFKCYEFSNSPSRTSVADDSIKVLHNDFGWETETIIKKRTLESVQLPTKVKNSLLGDLELFLKEDTKNRYRSLEVPYNRIYMFYGPPGTGKTTMIQALASKFNKNIANIEFDSDIGDKTFKKMLRRVPPNTIICIEDIDCLFEDRKAMDCAKNALTFSGILNALDGISKLDQKIIIITTNHLDRLDDALKRRIDHFVKFDYSTKNQVSEMYHRFFPNGTQFERFWTDIKDLKVTPNILQKLLIRHSDENIHDAREFITGEHSTEIVRDLYT